MDRITTSRRDLLRAATTTIAYVSGAAIVGTGMAIASEAHSQTVAVAPRASVSPRLARLIALHDRADAACDRFDEEVEMPARRAFGAAVRAFPAETPPPHEEVATTFENAFGDTVRLSTDRVGAAAIAQKVLLDPTWADMGDEDWRQAHRELAAAYERRRAILDQQAERLTAHSDECRRRFRIDAIADRSEALADRRYRLWWAALSTPAANVADVDAKAALIARTNGDDENDVEHATFSIIAADLRRLAGRA